MHVNEDLVGWLRSASGRRPAMHARSTFVPFPFGTPKFLQMGKLRQIRAGCTHFLSTNLMKWTTSTYCIFICSTSSGLVCSGEGWSPPQIDYLRFTGSTPPLWIAQRLVSLLARTSRWSAFSSTWNVIWMKQRICFLFCFSLQYCTDLLKIINNSTKRVKNNKNYK
jgi:hypothetical protein